MSIAKQLLNYSATWRHLGLGPKELHDLDNLCSQFVGSTQFRGLTPMQKNDILILLFQLDLLTCHDIEAKATLEKLADVVSDQKVVEQSEWFIYYRSIYLECQSEAGGAASEKAVEDYVDNASKVLIRDFNRAVGQSLTGSGDATKLREVGDLYLMQKRKASLVRSKSTVKYVDALLKLTDERPLDTENWAELADVYLKEGEVEKAHYCLLELLIGLPFAYNVWAKLGEVALLMDKALGKRSNNEYLRNAVRYFSRSVELCDLYSRGWSGLYVALKRLGEDAEPYATLARVTDKKLHDILDNSLTNDADLDSIRWVLQNC